MKYLSLALMFGALWITTATNSHFSQDSWSYYELSRHIFDNFYHINTWRQYHIISEYGVSFPPLWPIILACFNAVFHIGIYAGFVLNFVIAGLTFLLLRRMAKIWFHEREFGCLVFFALMITPDYTTSLFSGGTLPLSILLILILLYLEAHKRYSPPMKAVLMGIVAGLAVLNRFDCLLPALVLGLFVRPLMWMAAVYYAVLLAALLPWIAHSYIHFGSFWVTDNSRTVLSSIPIFVRDYFPEGVPVLRDDPLGWIQKSMGSVLRSADIMFKTTGSLPWLLGAGLIVAKHPSTNRNVVVFGAMIAAQLVSVFLTGFIETRYYVPLELFLLVATLSMALPGRINHAFTKYIPMVFLGLSALYAGAYIAKSVAESAPISLSFNENNLEPKEFTKLLECMPEKHFVLLPPKNYSYKFGALTGIISFIEPTNMTEKNSDAFVAQFHPRYLLTSTPDIYHMQKDPLCTFKGWGESGDVYELYKLDEPVQPDQPDAPEESGNN